MGDLLLGIKGRFSLWYSTIRDLLFLKLKFAAASLIATGVDYVLFLLLIWLGFLAVPANILSASVGFLINFFMQKKFIFVLNRKFRQALLISVTFSIIGISLNTFFIWLLIKIDFFEAHPYITKLLVIGIIFFYNFYTKRFAFEKKWIDLPKIPESQPVALQHPE